ncbi:hypothetical protein [Alkalihalobacillus sp. LMS39]|uniref:hypothetical protein n=1 Tax=Alkalihalobacillus sp. LMS39 TaxID=2924032 RepID=UPI001FB35E20|nr:hypothetical protein [Alkalihalobacillus sp. LMS39]UOE93615.1 hypothetical protein MM271_20905 [Alkalihalobacillus sp. LMS39]
MTLFYVILFFVILSTGIQLVQYKSNKSHFHLKFLTVLLGLGLVIGLIGMTLILGELSFIFIGLGQLLFTASLISIIISLVLDHFLKPIQQEV